MGRPTPVWHDDNGERSAFVAVVSVVDVGRQEFWLWWRQPRRRRAVRPFGIVGEPVTKASELLLNKYSEYVTVSQRSPEMKQKRRHLAVELERHTPGWGKRQ